MKSPYGGSFLHLHIKRLASKHIKCPYSFQIPRKTKIKAWSRYSKILHSLQAIQSPMRSRFGSIRKAPYLLLNRPICFTFCSSYGIPCSPAIVSAKSRKSPHPSDSTSERRLIVFSAVRRIIRAFFSTIKV